MENLPLIKWHTKKLRDLLFQDANNGLTPKLAAELDRILNSLLLKDVVSVNFEIPEEVVAAANEAELKRRKWSSRL